MRLRCGWEMDIKHPGSGSGDHIKSLAKLQLGKVKDLTPLGVPMRKQASTRCC